MSLPEKLRLPLVLHYLEGYPLKEIAVILSIPQTTVKSQPASGPRRPEARAFHGGGAMKNLDRAFPPTPECVEDAIYEGFAAPAAARFCAGACSALPPPRRCGCARRRVFLPARPRAPGYRIRPGRPARPLRPPPPRARRRARRTRSPAPRPRKARRRARPSRRRPSRRRPRKRGPRPRLTATSPPSPNFPPSPRRKRPSLSSRPNRWRLPKRLSPQRRCRPPARWSCLPPKLNSWR